MQDEMCHLATGVLDELDLRIDYFQEKLGLRFGEDRKFRLPCGLGAELAVLESNGNVKARPQLVRSNVRREDRGGDGDFFSFGRKVDLAGLAYSRHVAATLMQYQAGDFALRIA